jgi:hypothetical protein
VRGEKREGHGLAELGRKGKMGEVKRKRRVGRAHLGNEREKEMLYKCI